MSAVPQYGEQQYPPWVVEEPVSVPSPAAGTAVVITAPSAVEWQLVSVCFKVVTSNAVASRVGRLVFLDSTGVSFGAFPQGFTLAASKTSRFSWGVGANNNGVNDGTYMSASIPAVWLVAGNQVKLDIDAIDTADQLSEVRLYVKQRNVTPLVPVE